VLLVAIVLLCLSLVCFAAISPPFAALQVFIVVYVKCDVQFVKADFKEHQICISFLLHSHKGYHQCRRRSVILLLQSTNNTAVPSLERDMVSTSKEREKSLQTLRPCWWKMWLLSPIFSACLIWLVCLLHFNYEKIVTRMSLKFKSNEWPSYSQFQNQLQQ